MKALLIILFVFAVSANSVTAKPPSRSVLLAAGKINDVTPPGSVDIVHQDGSREKASYGILVYPGDRFDFRKDAELSANVYGRRVTYSSGSADLSIPPRDVGLFSSQDESFIDRFMGFLSVPRQAIAVFPSVRSGEGKSLQLKESKFSPVGKVMLPEGASHAALIWEGGPGILMLKSDGTDERNLDSNRNAWLIASLPRGKGPIEIEIRNQQLKWTIEFSESIPAPPWFDGGALSESQRIVRAVWLLEHAPKEWNTFAVTELADLARNGNFVADQLWVSARSGELSKELRP